LIWVSRARLSGTPETCLALSDWTESKIFVEVWRKGSTLRWKQFLIHVDSGQTPLITGLVHGGLAHQDQHGLFVGHGSTHPQDTPEILVQPLNPVGRVNHRLNLRMEVQIREIVLIINQL